MHVVSDSDGRGKGAGADRRYPRQCGGGNASDRERCFLLRRETVWRRGGRCIPHVEILFPGCVFAEEDGKENFPERLERALRNLKTAGNMERNAEENYQEDRSDLIQLLPMRVCGAMYLREAAREGSIRSGRKTG